MPQAHPELECLTGWSREKLERSFKIFCLRPTLGVNFENFAEILEFEQEDEHAAFKKCHPKKGKVDMLSIFAAMVATSNQRFISRISFLFSIFDLDGNGSINGAEFYIALNGLMKGIALFFDSAMVPSKRDVEEIVTEVFCRIDTDQSGYITLGELLCYAYRSKELRTILEPFPADDQRIFEELLVCPRTKDERYVESFLDSTYKIEEQLSLSPDTSGSARRSRRASISFRESPLKKAAGISKAHTWFLYEVFFLLSGGRLHNTIPFANIRDVLADHRELEKVLEQVAKAAGVVVAPREHYPMGSRQRRLSTTSGSEEGISKLIQHIRNFFSHAEVLSKFDLLGEGSISIRAFFCVVLPTVSENNIETCLRWCESFRARDVLMLFIESGDIKNGLDVNDLRTIFQALDKDKNGHITVEELMEVGTLTQEQAASVVQRLDMDHNGTLSADELQGILFSVDTTLRADLRTAFAGKNGQQGLFSSSDADTCISPEEAL